MYKLAPIKQWNLLQFNYSQEHVRDFTPTQVLKARPSNNSTLSIIRNMLCISHLSSDQRGFIQIKFTLSGCLLTFPPAHTSQFFKLKLKT